MTPTWAPDDDDIVDLSTIGLMGWLLFVMRAVPILVLVFGCLILLLLLRFDRTANFWAGSSDDAFHYPICLPQRVSFDGDAFFDQRHPNASRRGSGRQS